jgi:hypothetical protein
MTPKQLERRCLKLFGPSWVQELAFNLGYTPQAISNMKLGKRRISPLMIAFLEQLESGAKPIKKRPDGYWRKFTCRKGRGHRATGSDR